MIDARAEAIKTADLTSARDIASLTVSLITVDEETRKLVDSSIKSRGLRSVFAEFSFGAFEESFLNGTVELSLSLKRAKLIIEGNQYPLRVDDWAAHLNFTPHFVDVSQKTVGKSQARQSSEGGAEVESYVGRGRVKVEKSVADSRACAHETKYTHSPRQVSVFRKDDFLKLTFDALDLKQGLVGPPHEGVVCVTKVAKGSTHSPIKAYFSILPTYWVINGGEGLPAVKRDLFKFLFFRDYREKIDLAFQRRALIKEMVENDHLTLCETEIQPDD